MYEVEALYSDMLLVVVPSESVDCDSSSIFAMLVDRVHLKNGPLWWPMRVGPGLAYQCLLLAEICVASSHVVGDVMWMSPLCCASPVALLPVRCLIQFEEGLPRNGGYLMETLL